MASDLFRSLNRELLPAPTGVAPKLQRLDDIRSVVFDIYGTLIISAAGDISLADGSQRGHFIRDAIQEETGSVLPNSIDDHALAERYLAGIVAAQESRRKNGIEFPEVDIREIWSELLGSLDRPAVAETIERIATRYECLTNPVWPMPGLDETLGALDAAPNLSLGIVSNAQFYTLSMFPAFLADRTLLDLGFPESLQVYSYRLKEGKPSTQLYETLVVGLREAGIEPQEALFVGNDIRNDIWPAAAVGMRTALFAGDARSLRLREDDPRVSEVVPDLVITELSQLLDCVPIEV